MGRLLLKQTPEVFDGHWYRLSPARMRILLGIEIDVAKDGRIVQPAAACLHGACICAKRDSNGFGGKLLDEREAISHVPEQ